MCVPPPVPSPVVTVSGQAESELVAGSSLSLACSNQPQGGGSVDTAATIMSSWNAPDSARNTESTVAATSATTLDLNIASVQTADTGVYTCSASVTDSSGSVYIMDSTSANDTVSITVSKSTVILDHFFHFIITIYSLSFSELNVTIILDYIPAPGEDPGELGPNEFKAGTVLSLICMAQGASRDLTYSWSVAGNPDTPSDCTCNIITTPTIPMTLEVGPFLQSFRAGTYTCTVNETGRPNSGSSDDFTVVVVGEYLHVCAHAGSEINVLMLLLQVPVHMLGLLQISITNVP